MARQPTESPEAEAVLDINSVSLELARALVKVAREAIKHFMTGSRRLYEIPRELKEKHPELDKYASVFVTLEKITEKEGVRGRELRGCIGFIEPIFPLGIAVIESAISSAFNDPRFPPLRPRELGETVVTLTLLGRKKQIKSLKEIVIGRDALYVERPYYRRLFSGILLPEVPVEYCWDTETFANMTCMKAGLEEKCWTKPGTTLYTIPGRTLREIEPEGEIEEVDLTKEYEEHCKTKT